MREKLEIKKKKSEIEAIPENWLGFTKNEIREGEEILQWIEGEIDLVGGFDPWFLLMEKKSKEEKRGGEEESVEWKLENGM